MPITSALIGIAVMLALCSCGPTEILDPRTADHGWVWSNPNPAADPSQQARDAAACSMSARNASPNVVVGGVGETRHAVIGGAVSVPLDDPIAQGNVANQCMGALGYVPRPIP